MKTKCGNGYIEKDTEFRVWYVYTTPIAVEPVGQFGRSTTPQGLKVFDGGAFFGEIINTTDPVSMVEHIIYNGAH